ncbi:unnamed protein product [Parascedosporium putredinis]|uniref:Uncharacterized protein n=1 Tax=Parascedosporium putredinis TaxID=1442378 RepID=A0A9P1H2Y1_9PEZI|nr:unnamed protein product [Parascedosporium putredinis]CAI7995317.1 unnamed protein product [Parascedosporium putredinis]
MGNLDSFHHDPKLTRGEGIDEEPARPLSTPSLPRAVYEEAEYKEDHGDDDDIERSEEEGENRPPDLPFAPIPPTTTRQRSSKTKLPPHRRRRERAEYHGTSTRDASPTDDRFSHQADPNYVLQSGGNFRGSTTTHRLPTGPGTNRGLGPFRKRKRKGPTSPYEPANGGSQPRSIPTTSPIGDSNYVSGDERGGGQDWRVSDPGVGAETHSPAGAYWDATRGTPVDDTATPTGLIPQEYKIPKTGEVQVRAGSGKPTVRRSSRSPYPTGHLPFQKWAAPDGLTESQKRELQGPSPENLNRKGLWNHIFDIAFQGHMLPPQSPYVYKPLQLEIYAYREYLDIYGARVISDVVTFGGKATWNLPDEERDRAALQHITLKEGIWEMVEKFMGPQHGRAGASDPRSPHGQAGTSLGPSANRSNSRRHRDPATSGRGGGRSTFLDLAMPGPTGRSEAASSSYIHLHKLSPYPAGTTLTTYYWHRDVCHDVSTTVSTTKTVIQSSTTTTTKPPTQTIYSTVPVQGSPTTTTTISTSTAIVTEYIETVVEQNAAPTVYSTRHVITQPTITTTVKKRDIAGQLKAYATKVVSSACNCYVTAPTTTIYVQTVVSTAKATSTLSFKTTVTSVVKTITQGPPRPGTSTVFTTVPGATDTVTTTTVVDSTVPGTTTRTEVITPTAFVSGLQFIRTGTYMSYCKPQGYLAVQLAPAALSSEDTFQFCASLCAQTSGCTQIFVGTPNPQNAGEQALCFIGGVAPVAPRHLAARVPELSKTYWTASDISCNQVLVNGVGTWYDRYYGAVATMTEE